MGSAKREARKQELIVKHNQYFENSEAHLLALKSIKDDNNPKLTEIADEITRINQLLNTLKLTASVTCAAGGGLYLCCNILTTISIVVPHAVVEAAVGLCTAGSVISLPDFIIKGYPTKAQIDRIKQVIQTEMPALTSLVSSMILLFKTFINLNSEFPDDPLVVSMKQKLSNFCTQMLIDMPNENTVVKFVSDIFQCFGMPICSHASHDEEMTVECETGEWEYVLKQQTGDSQNTTSTMGLDDPQGEIKNIDLIGIYVQQLLSGSTSTFAENIRNNVERSELNVKMIGTLIDLLRFDNIVER